MGLNRAGKFARRRAGLSGLIRRGIAGDPGVDQVHMPGIKGEGGEWVAAAFVEFIEKLDILQTAVVYVGGQQAHRQVKSVPDDADERGEQNAQHDERPGKSAEHHAGEHIHHHGDDSGGEAERKNAGIGQDVAEIPGDVVQAAETSRDLSEDDVTLIQNQKLHLPTYGHPVCIVILQHSCYMM